MKRVWNSCCKWNICICAVGMDYQFRLMPIAPQWNETVFVPRHDVKRTEPYRDVECAGSPTTRWLLMSWIRDGDGGGE